MFRNAHQYHTSIYVITMLNEHDQLLITLHSASAAPCKGLPATCKFEEACGCIPLQCLCGDYTCINGSEFCWGVCVCGSLRLYVYIYIRVCVSVYGLLGVYVCDRFACDGHLFAYTRLVLDVCVNVCMPACVCMFAYTMFMYMCAYTYIAIHLHAQ
jgi:hypothetical protein